MKKMNLEELQFVQKTVISTLQTEKYNLMLNIKANFLRAPSYAARLNVYRAGEKGEPRRKNLEAARQGTSSLATRKNSLLYLTLKYTIFVYCPYVYREWS